jgi:hypothetical protein
MLRNAALFITWPKKALTAGPRFGEVQLLTIKPLFSRPPLGVSPRNGLVPSPKPFASTLVCIRIHFCEKAQI